jgi:hypothetical protein
LLRGEIDVADEAPARDLPARAAARALADGPRSLWLPFRFSVRTTAAISRLCASPGGRSLLARDLGSPPPGSDDNEDDVDVGVSAPLLSAPLPS